MDAAVSLFNRLGIAEANAAVARGDGSWTRGHGGFASINPALGQPLATVGRADRDDLDELIGRARQAFPTWRDRPAPQRGLLVRDIAEALREHKDELGTLICLEVGKLKAEGNAEVQEMIDIADFAVGLSRQFHGLTLPSERPQHRMEERWHPRGVVGVITAFNFPAAVWAWNAFIAAVCGDVVVWKPSPHAPLTAIAIQNLVDPICVAHGVTGLFSLAISDDPARGAQLAADPRLDLLSFTGSSRVGGQVAATVAAHYGHCLLECSGNNAVIVDASADLELALPAILFGAIGTAGQRCTSTRRLFLHRACHDEVVARLTAAYAHLRVGDPLQPDTLVGPLIDEAARGAFVAAVAGARNAGGRVLHGGRTLPGPGCFVEPTLIAAENRWPVVQRETFAPILYVMPPFEDLADAIRDQNDVPQGLSSALFTRDLRHAELFLAAAGSDCGIANVNLGTSGAEIGGAFGGEKATGGGREAGSDAWKAYMRRQTCTVNWGDTLPLAQNLHFDLPPH
ncbi:MAG: aldehyde dehydrogenase family protein [Rhodocyclales bacterium]|nr:aldehyde dehydrogenase family protein [Rhodocyclales bacterium]